MILISGRCGRGVRVGAGVLGGGVFTSSIGSNPFNDAGTDTSVWPNCILKSRITLAGNCGADSKSLEDSSLMSSKSLSALKRSALGRESSKDIRA